MVGADAHCMGAWVVGADAHSVWEGLGLTLCGRGWNSHCVEGEGLWKVWTWDLLQLHAHSVCVIMMCPLTYNHASHMHQALCVMCPLTMPPPSSDVYIARL